MSILVSRQIRRRVCAAMVCCCALWSPVYSALAQEAPGASGVEGEANISDAERFFRVGVALYRDGNYREALDEFNRALALEPGMDKAQDFRDKCEARLHVSATGGDPTAVPSFETFDPGALGPLQESPQLSSEEHKIQKVRELVELAEQFLEHQFYDEAVEYFEQVLLIAPDNRRAKEGLHKATIGAYETGTESVQDKVSEQNELFRRYIEKQKLLPEGADASGIKNYRISVPQIEEKIDSEGERSHIDVVLDSPVGVVFEDIHLRDILDFITDTYEVNIMVDNRVVAPPRQAQPQAAVQPTPARGRRRGSPPPRARQQQQRGGQRGRRNQGGGRQGGQQGQQEEPQFVTDGMISYINLKNVTLREALKAILHPLNLGFSNQPSFIWISTPQKIREETFEELETRYYELRNAGSETLFKIIIENPGGEGQIEQIQSGGGGGGGGGGRGGGGGSSGGGGGGRGGGGGGGGQASGGFQNISELFTTIDDSEVGEFPNPFAGGGGRGRTGVRGGPGGGAGGGPGGLGAAGGVAGEPQVMFVLRSLIPNIIEPITRRVLSFMTYNLLTNQLIVHNTPSNLVKLEKLIDNLDVTPKQVSIEAKFLTINVNDLEKRGFQWNLALSDLNSRSRGIPGLTSPEVETTGGGGGGGGGSSGGGIETIETFPFDINGDGIAEEVPFSRRPDGTNFIDNTISSGILEALVSPGPAGAFKLSGIIQKGEDGDSLSVVFDYLDSLKESELLSAPRITTMNQKPAVIADIRTEWFVRQIFNDVTTSTGSGIGGETTTVVTQTKIPQQFFFGITLSVTPQISAEDQVRMWLNPQVTTKIGVSSFQQQQVINNVVVNDVISLPETSVQSVWTNVIVHDGDTLVLGGLVSDVTEKGEERMPYLSDLPVIGFFFRGKSREVKQSSLLIFVTPDIIDTTGARYFEPGL